MKKALLKEYLPKVEMAIGSHLERLPSSAKIAVGISGGVDSAVTLLLLKEMGLNVFAVFMRNWIEIEADGSCSAERDYSDVVKVCDQLDVPYFSVDLSRNYQDKVFSQFIEQIKMGRTPNPDILCNREIKFAAFWDVLKKMGADCMATGHYAKSGFERGEVFLKRSLDELKDQSYFLAQMPKEMLRHSLFPLGFLRKIEVRSIAKSFGLANSLKKDSTGICFIGERNFQEFVANYIQETKGDFRNYHGQAILGQHLGACFYTKGQRKGLGIGGPEGPWFVVDKDKDTNTVYVTNQEEDPSLYSGGCNASNLNFFVNGLDDGWVKCTSKIRYRQNDGLTKFLVEKNRDGAQVIFDPKQRAVTEGQFVVFYDNERCLGSGLIENTFS